MHELLHYVAADVVSSSVLAAAQCGKLICIGVAADDA